MPDDWVVEYLDQRPVPHRRRRYASDSPQALSNLPADWRDLLTRWVKRGGNSRWETLKKDAGVAHQKIALSLLDWLLRHGWAVVDEERKLGDWWPLRVELRDLAALRAALNLPDNDELAARWITLRGRLEAQADTELVLVINALDSMPVQRALDRGELVLSLLQWRTAERSGTRRDFALFARDDTKGLSESEWNWLEQTLDLAEFRIERHTPLLLLSAPLTLNMPHGQIDLTSYVDFAALTPATLQATTAASGTISRWQLVENRTSFERVARQREYDVGVIWLPGFPPSWWRSSVGQLLDLAPAPAHIACDPDPAGIAIALKAAELWSERGIAWLPWKMSATDLATLRARKPLTEVDRLQLASLRQETTLSTQLAELVEWMLEHGEKGEQEGYL